MNRTFKPEREKIQIIILENYLADHDEIFTRSPHHECALVPWLPNKSKMAAADIFNLGKMSITADWIKILHQILWEDAPQPCGDDHVTKSRNRTLICVTSSNERLKDKCVDLSDYPNLVQNTNTILSTRRNGQIHII